MGITALTGYDPLTGAQVEGLGRVLAAAGFLAPFAGRILGAARNAWAAAGEAQEIARLGLRATRDLRAGVPGLLRGLRGGADDAAGLGSTALRETVEGVGTEVRPLLRPSSHSPYQVHIDPITGRGPMAIDTSTFASGAATASGGIRNSRAFWQGWAQKYGTTLSPRNRAAISEGLSPMVDDVWLRTFPEHAPQTGETIVHHHLERGAWAIPLPDPVHRNVPGFGFWHG